MTQELAKFQEVISPAPAILEQSATRVEKAKEVGLQLLAKIEQEGMTEQMDHAANDYLVKVKKTYTLMNTARAPITQLLDQVKKRFTALEAELAPKTSGGIYSQVQAHRDAFAKQKLEEQRKREEKARRKQAIEDEKVKVLAEIETRFAEYFIDHLTAKKDELQMVFNSTPLDKFEDYKEAIKTFPEEYSDKHLAAFTVSIHSIYLTSDQLSDIIAEVIADKITQYKADFKTGISELKKDLWDKLPSKKTELEAIAKAEAEDQEEADRLKKEKEERERKEKERLAKEAEKKRLAEFGKTEAKKEEGKMDNMFNAATGSHVAETPSQERTGYNITVTHPAGYAPIFSFWFENEGSNLAMDAIEKRTVKQMKSLCEKVAHKTGEKIQSPYIKYEEVVKTRVKS